jgi:uncharacterized OsmC-like protein
MENPETSKMGEDRSSIESSAYPLAFRVDPSGLKLEPLPTIDGIARIRTFARTLEGMQKEAVIHYGPTGAIWRVVSDEGPWLNGTDLAPFPLAFFAAGVAASLMSEFLGEARDRDIRIDSLNLVQDNFFTMEGSALKGTMAAGVQPMQVSISARSNAAATDIENIAETAVRSRSPAERCLREVLISGFAVRANNEELAWPGKGADTVAALTDPAGVFDDIHPISNDDTTLIRKSAGVAESQGNAIGLGAEQKRVVHVRTEGSIRQDGLKSIDVQCIQPAGSRFQMLSDDSKVTGGQGRAPSGLAYLSAGVAFCFMTQIGRYAQITKQRLNGYRIIQDTAFRFSRDHEPQAFAVETLVCLDTDEPEDKSIQLVRMAEQTCYIHAAYRTPTATELTIGD